MPRRPFYEENPMKPFTIGTWVLVNAVTEMTYVGQDRLATSRPCEPFYAQITGQCCRHEGHYVPGSSPQVSFFGSDDGYQQAALAVSKAVKLWLVRAGLTNRELEARDEDLIVLDDPRQLPTRQIGVPIYVEEKREQ